MQIPKNPLELFRLYTQFAHNNNPMWAFKKVFGNDPVFNRLEQMISGKSEEEVKNTVLNLCSERGINVNKCISILRGVGFKI